MPQQLEQLAQVKVSDPEISGATSQVDIDEIEAQVNSEKKLKEETPEEEPELKKEPWTCASFLHETFVKDIWFWVVISMLFLANIAIHRYHKAGVWFGFALSAYSAIANDSIQTLGTFIAATKETTAWWKQWIYVATIFNVTVLYSWYYNNGDITFERLQSKGFKTQPQSFEYMQTAAPIILLILTRLRVPVSTTFMILTVFVTKPKALGKTVMKSVSGYGLSFVLAVVVYLPFSPCIRQYCEKTMGKLPMFWTPILWVTTGVLWSVWLMQDMSNIAVYLPRELSLLELLVVLSGTTAGLALMLWQGGEKIQRVVDEKSRIKDIPEATMINFIFAVILFVFKIYSKLPMSTTWCFIGLLAGRELSMALRKVGQGCKDSIFMSLKDLLAVTFGFMVSLAIGIGGNPYMRQWAITSK